MTCQKKIDKELLLDCINTLNKKAKSYRRLYKLNKRTKISVKASVGESKTAPIKDSGGQGSFSATLVSLEVRLQINSTEKAQLT